MKRSKETSQHRLLRRFSKMRGVDYGECLSIFQNLKTEDKATYLLQVSQWLNEVDKALGEKKNLEKKLKSGKIVEGKSVGYVDAPKPSVEIHDVE